MDDDDDSRLSDEVEDDVEGSLCVDEEADDFDGGLVVDGADEDDGGGWILNDKDDSEGDGDSSRVDDDGNLDVSSGGGPRMPLTDAVVNEEIVGSAGLGAAGASCSPAVAVDTDVVGLGLHQLY